MHFMGKFISIFIFCINITLCVCQNHGDRDETEVLFQAICNNLKFILDNTARILTRKNGFNRHEISTYLLPVVISDNDYPIQSSTGTLTIRVCACDSQGNMQSCSAEALLLPAGLSTGALIAILLCIIILLGKECQSK